MKISVVIASYRSSELVRSCVESLACQEHPPCEIILVVDRVDQQDEFVRFFGPETREKVTVLASGKKGVSAARNKGVAESSGDIIAFIDDDATADPRWTAQIEQAYNSHPDAAVVGGPVKPVFEGRKIDEKWYWIIGCTSSRPPTKRPICCNMAITRKAFDEIGGFEENLGRVKRKLAIGEETDLLLRIQEEMPGSPIVWNPHAIVFHWVPRHRTTLRYILDRSYEEGVGKAIIGKTHDLGLEQTFLRYYLTHPDRFTLPVLLAVGVGFVMGMITVGRTVHADDIT